jgi:hypothetical protein
MVSGSLMVTDTDLGVSSLVVVSAIAAMKGGWFTMPSLPM